jgi:hypothetical protein
LSLTGDRPPTSWTTSTSIGSSTVKAWTIAFRVLPQDRATVWSGVRISASQRADRVPSCSSCEPPEPKASTCASARLKRRRRVRSSSTSRRTGWVMRISTMPCSRAALSMRETLDRVVPSISAISACERWSTK